MNTHEFNEWMQRKGFVPNGTGGWHKPRRVPVVCEAQNTNAERTTRDAPVEPIQRETLYSGRCAVRITSFRRRLCDPDGLIGKWFLDAVRYAGLIREDDANSITYSISQVKVRSKEEEGTLIEITQIDVDN